MRVLFNYIIEIKQHYLYIQNQVYMQNRIVLKSENLDVTNVIYYSYQNTFINAKYYNI